MIGNGLLSQNKKTKIRDIILKAKSDSENSKVKSYKSYTKKDRENIRRVEQDRRTKKLKNALIITRLIKKGKQYWLDLWEIYTDGFRGGAAVKNPQRLLEIIKMRWELEKEIADMEIYLNEFKY